MNLSGIRKVQLRGALAAAIATIGLLVAIMPPATGINEDWPEGAMIEAPGELELPPPEPDPSPGPSPSQPPGDDELIARYLVFSVRVWEISPPPDPTPIPSGPPGPTATATVALERVAVMQQVRCNTVAATATGLNLVRATLFTYEMEVDWCWNGAKVTSTAGPRIAGNVSWWAAVAWNYEGVRNMNGPADRLGNQTTYRTYSQGAFSNTPPPKLWTIQRVYPRLWIDVFGTGASRTWGAW
ncbi:MAG TPA: hypothetical protein VFC19_30915 [Candidatus Limnocylindrales bacterium]|nr:hypothetical protein [Candidatus Limnocylindrales bacterium]